MSTYHLLVLQLLGDVTRTAARDFDPGLGEDGTCAQHEGNVDYSVDGIKECSL